MSAAKNGFAKLPASCFVLVIFAQLCFSQTAPRVFKVDPPSWWVGHSLNPVRLLIQGNNLHGARVQPLDRGVRFGMPKVNSTGTHLFVDAFIARNTRPGMQRFEITTANGKTNATFEVLNPLPRAGRFAGFPSFSSISLGRS